MPSNNIFPPLMKMPRVRFGLSVVRRHLRNTSCTAPHLPAKEIIVLAAKALESLFA